MHDRANPRRVESLARFHSYLGVLARGAIPQDLRARLGESDIVAQVLLRAVEDFGKFRGRTDQAFKAYLRVQLAHVLIDTLRGMRRQSRDPRREQRIRDEIERTDARLETFVAAQVSTGPTATSRSELRQRVLEVVASLPADQYYVVEQRRLRGRPTREVAEELGRSQGAVRKLEARALQTLRSRLSDAWPP